jgi:AraC-like DNA-binding protein
MLSLREESSLPQRETQPDSSAVAMVRSESLRYFDQLVRAMGGDPAALFAAARIHPAIVEQRDQLIAYRQMILLLERAADALACPDFGLQLARRQYAEGILGPLDIAMRNSPTVGEAWRFCAEHVHAYSSGAHVTLAPAAEGRRWLMRFEILVPRVYRQRQAAEHALLISHLATRMFSGGRAVAREVWFAHAPLAGAAAYAEGFGCPIRFAQPCNGLFFDKADFAAPVIDRDERVLELATFFIDARFPAPDAMLRTKVRIAIEQQLGKGMCTQVEVAAALGMHPRTLQRRLRSEGENFEAIKDEVRREAAIRYLRETRLPLKTIAAMLGYSELSVLYRSCHRWFGEPPSTVRQISDIAMLEGREVRSSA